MGDWPELTIQNVALSAGDTASLFRTYAQRHAATIREYDLGHGGDTPNTVTVADLGRMIFMNAGLDGDDAATLLKLANAPTMDWAAIPIDASITDPDVDPDDDAPSSLWQQMQSCYSVLDVNGLGPAKITKLLHLKRPKLFPILDSFVQRFYRDAGVTRQWWAAIRADVLANTHAWNQLRSAAAASEDHVACLATLSDLRLHDIAVWSTAARNR